MTPLQPDESPHAPGEGAFSMDDGGPEPEPGRPPSEDEVAVPEPGGQARPETPAEGDSDAIRRVLLARFDRWLRRTLADEPSPEGVAAELLAEVQSDGDAPPEDALEAQEAADEYAIRSAMLSLAQEVKLQGRAFDRLRDSLSPISEAAEELGRDVRAQTEKAESACAAAEGARAAAESVLGAAEAGCAAAERAATAAEQSIAERVEGEVTRVRAEMLNVLVDVRDRLARGASAAAERAEAIGPPSGAAKWFASARSASAAARESADALRQGCEMALARVDEALAGWGVVRIQCEGRPFDPSRMVAADVDNSGAAPDGTVTEVYREGYEWRGAVFRPAQVKVARAAGNGGNP